MAMDYLPVQASSVPCERVFSSSAETDTKRRNRMTSATMEALQMLKFHLKKARLNFMEGWVTPDEEMLSDEPDDDLLAKLLTDEGQLHDVLDNIIQCVSGDQAKAAAEPVHDK
jgi:hAT family C-terminal dimerisation region